MRLSSSLRRFRWAVFVVWLLLLVPALYLGVNQSGHLTGGGFEVAGSQSLYVQNELEEQFPDQGASPLALVAAPRADASFADMDAAVAHLERLAAEVPSVKVVPNPQQPPPQPDRPYVLTLQLDFNNTGAVDVAKQLRQKVGINGDQPGEIQDGKVKLYVIGQGALGAAATAATKHDITQAEQWNLPIVLVVLLAVFGSLAAAAMPLVLGICTVAVTMGLVYLLSMFTTMSVFVTSTVSMFGIALAIDYSLFILMRFREELRAGRDPQQAADAAMATSGLAVVLSGLTVIASVTGIYLINTPVLVSMATGAILAVAVAVLTSTTLTPAVLATFGQAAAKRSWLLHWSRRPETTQSRFWTRWTGAVMRRPWLSALAATAFLLTLAAPAFSMVLGNSMQRQFDPTHEIRGGVNAAADGLGPGALGPVRVLVTFPEGNPASAPVKEPLLAAVQQRMSQAPNVVTVQPAVFGNDYRSALVSAVLSVDPEDMAARESVDWMREQLPPVAGPNAKVDVGGPTALIKDFDDRVSKTQPAVFGFVALIAFVMLLISVRSVFLAFKGVLMTVLSVAAAYGSLVVVFQWGWLESLGFRPISSLDSTIPPLVLAMTFGLSMDYEIFLLTRIRERFLQTNNTRDAVAYGVSTSARTITSAALIMIAVFTRLRVRGHAAGGAARRRVRGGDRRRRHRGAVGSGARPDGDVPRMELVAAGLAGSNTAVGRLREAAAESRHRRPGHHPGRHFDAGGIRNRYPHGGQVGGQAQNHGAAHDFRRRSARAQWLPTAQGFGRMHQGWRRAAAERRQRSHQRQRERPHRHERQDDEGAAGPDGPCTPSRCGVAGCRWRWMPLKPRPTPSGHPSSATARWRPPTSSCPPATGCRYRPGRRRCG